MMTAAYFDALYKNCDDPWHFKTQWYEIRKRALILAALPQPRYRYAFEPGCSNGEFTAELAARCDYVHACDISDYIVGIARQRLSRYSNLTLTTAAIPDQWPQSSFDLIVLNEVGYYLRAEELERTRQNILGSLNENGTLVLCHWRHDIDDCDLNGEDVHALFLTGDAFEQKIHHRETDFLLDIVVKAETKPQHFPKSSLSTNRRALS